MPANDNHGNDFITEAFHHSETRHASVRISSISKGKPLYELIILDGTGTRLQQAFSANTKELFKLAFDQGIQLDAWKIYTISSEEKFDA